jgi:hypothetical protein
VAKYISKTFDAGAFADKAFSTVDYEREPNAFDGDTFDGGGTFDAPMVLLFNQQASDVTTDLVFSRGVGQTIPDATISATIAAGEPVLSSAIALGIPVAVAVLNAGEPVLSCEVIYSTQTARPLVANVVARHQDAQARHEGIAQRHQDAERLPQGIGARFQPAKLLEASTAVRQQDARRLRNGPSIRYQDGTGLRAGVNARFQEGLRSPVAARGLYQEGRHLSRGQVQRFQEGLRNPAALHLARYQDARPRPFSVVSRVGSGRAIERGWSTRYQEGTQPRPGLREVVVPPVDPCYIPDPHLLFATRNTFGRGGFGEAFDPSAFDFQFQAGESDLVFVCDRHGGGPVDPGEPAETIVVPVRRIYTVINTATLKRVTDGANIPTTSMGLTIDVDSWTWSFTARVPGVALTLLEPALDGEPVEVEATINGVAYRALVEGISRERSFARSDLSITGRGRAAVLDAPYSAVRTFGNTDARTVQQLANDVLTINGVSLGWNVDDAWTPDDWLVPAGVFSHQGSHMSALNAIVAAAGAYVQPHATAKALRVLRRYPVAPWEWGDVTPDYELPAAVVSKESIAWSNKPNYNRVFVRGMKSGIVGQVTRNGTDGSLEAPMVTDQLITNAIGARQRALPVLADTGRQAAVTLRLPVLAETGIVMPGKFVRYVDGDTTRVGLVRSSSTEVQRADKALTIWQTIGVETHVNV